MNAADVLFFEEPVPLGKRVLLMRIARGLRQMDPAYLATQELARRGLMLRVHAGEVSVLERGFSISSRKKKAILAVLGLEDDVTEGPESIPLPPRKW
jgi:hypothetical protein